MISYLILHYNRPFLLETNIKILRKYYPNIQIVVADDGSHPEVVTKIKKLPIDDLFVQSSDHKNEWQRGTCSNTIKNGRKLCKHEYVIFSEDDFFFNPDSFDRVDPTEDEIMPAIKWPNEFKFDVFNESIELFKSNKNIKNIRLSKDPARVPVCDEFNTANIKWHHIDHIKKKSCYYSNWPSVLRTSEYNELKINSGMAIWTFEGFFSKSVDAKFGHGNWAVCPDKRFYIHTGMPFSQRLDDWIHSGKRIKAGEKIQEHVFNKIISGGLEDFNKMLLKQYIKDRFFIDSNDLFDKNLNIAFFNAFERLSRYF